MLATNRENNQAIRAVICWMIIASSGGQLTLSETGVNCCNEAQQLSTVVSDCQSLPSATTDTVTGVTRVTIVISVHQHQVRIIVSEFLLATEHLSTNTSS